MSPDFALENGLPFDDGVYDRIEEPAAESGEDLGIAAKNPSGTR